MCALAVLLLLLGQIACGDNLSPVPVTGSVDWPTYRGDAGRSGYTEGTLADDLTVHWRFTARHAPRPAWSGRDTRMPFDRAMHPVVSDGRVFFGSSVDCKVYALDAATGDERWHFFCDGPIRFAPAVDGDRLFVVSDDGHLYCLATADGSLLWRIRGGPTGSNVLGNGRLISRWPARGGPVVGDGVVYFAAGIWPSEGIFIHAVDAKSGEVLWCNDRTGSLWTAQPHPGADAASGVAAQGYLVLAGDKLLVPTGRAVPAVFDRETGELLYFHLQKNGHVGGADVVAGNGWFLNGVAAFELATGNRYTSVPNLSTQLAVAGPTGVVQWESGELRTLRWEQKTATDRKGTDQATTSLSPLKAVEFPGGSALAVAGKKTISAGTGPEGYLVAITETGSGKACWSSPTEAEPLGLAVADGRLFVAMADGTLECFGGCDAAPSKVAATNPPESESPFDNVDLHAKYAEEIVDRTGVEEGYCVDVACGDGALAYTLAGRTKLRIYAFDSDPEMVAQARRNLAAAGLYGARVTVRVADKGLAFLPDYMADLVVSGRSVQE
ncbi:MAG: PQQ-binding-like beta-propeller repeat protein, partial [bacterium]